MKQIFNCVTALLCAVSCSFCFASAVFAEESNGLISLPIAEPAMDIETVINDTITDALVKERYETFALEKPENYTFDTSVYILEYNVSTDYWGEVTSFDYNGLTEKIDYNYPTIYIPLFGDIENSDGVISNRVIGSIKVYYNWMKNDYKFNMMLHNLESENYKNRINEDFYEKITDYISQNDIAAQQTFLIRYPSSLSFNQEVIAVIQSETDVVILDMFDTCRIQTESTVFQTIAYSVEEYRSLRMEAEKTIYQKAEDWETNPAGGIANVSQDKAVKGLLFDVLPYALLVVVLVGAIFAVILIKRKKNNSKDIPSYVPEESATE